MAVVRKKQDDKILKTLRELVSIGGNKECFDCGQKGPTYINMTIGSFVCTTCSGILRGITPPHRVKSISMATFTQEEIDFVRQNGNDACSRTWLGLWDPKRAIKQEHRDFMIDKYERKRYYLEPASPLKSLPTNGTTSATTASSSSSSSTLASATNGNGSSTNINGSTSSNNSSSSSKNGAENLVPLKTITLTPPTSLRLSRTSSNSSGGLANGSHTGSSTNLKFQQQFTPDDSNFFSSDPPKILPPTPQKHSSNHHQRLNGSATVNGTNFERNQKNGLLTSTITNGINKFTPDTDFVADFSNANIIVNAATTTTTTTANGLKNGTGSSNHRRLSNGFSENGNGLIPNGHRNGETENFADFEHNTIYNAAEQHSSGSLNLSIDSGNSTTASSSSTTSVNSLNNDLFINNYSLLNNNNGPAVGGGAAALGGDAPTFGSPQFVAFSGGGVFGPQPQRPPPSNGNGYSYFQNYPQHQQQQQAVASSGSSSLNFVTSANGQWNLGWPQWAPHDQQQYQQQQQQQKQHNCTNQNRWSLPISASSRSSSALSSATPSVDRYAALKDLDDQFREIKFESETNNNHVISSSASTNGLSNGLMNGNHTNDVHQVSTANPFKTANPFQQQPQQQQQQTLSWAIPGSTPPTATNGFYASSSSPYQNGFVHPAAAAANLLNGNGVNGFTNAFHHHPSSNGSTGSINNNNGYGHIQAGVVPPYGVHHGGAVNHFGHFGNPFMAAGATTATSNSNNPFL
ncbi:arf-GAP domain and FG repeat-containing protein 1 [Culex quinquefasciatus]|uniref:arf-GAP domain and FG repeat-containing protein 1 n=1 Tax=Culex quinquefasciatus TaxID=7176 RepID=UPI0018E3D8DD|nr:arf-GAP domain and FG repeat-containing protein 1 [Culex quinquefasciatus]